MDPAVDLCQIPAGPSPNGRSNFENPASLAPAMMSVMGILVAWGIAFTATRFYINARKLGWADYLNLASLCCAIAILGYQATQLNMARHIWDVPACFFDGTYAQGIFIPAVLLQLGAFLAKASIFLLFLQLFTIQKPMRTAVWAGMAFNFAVYVSGIVVAIYYETPRAGETWLAVLDGRTLIPLGYWQAQSALSVVLDLYIFILPLPIIAKLKLPIRRRLPVIAVFSLALLGIGASIASLVERVHITHTNDTTWISAILALCSYVELTVAIIVCSAPAFSSFARLHLANLSMVKLLLSTLSSHSRRSKVDDSEAAGKVGISDNAGVKGIEDVGPNHRYYELKDAKNLKSWAIRDQDLVQTSVPPQRPENGIMRTVMFEQEVDSNLAKGLIK